MLEPRGGEREHVGRAIDSTVIRHSRRRRMDGTSIRAAPLAPCPSLPPSEVLAGQLDVNLIPAGLS